VPNALTIAVSLVHLDQEQELCVFTDASNRYWGTVVMQILSVDCGRPIENQAHLPLMFLGGTFTGATERRILSRKRRLFR
jgi:hypothetical protein